MENNYKKDWQDYRDKELRELSRVLADIGFVLEEEQVHIGGERYLSGGKKLVLIGRREADNKKVVIKASSDSAMKQEIENEWNFRQILKKINFAYHIFFSPAKVLFTVQEPYTIFITEFIEQKSSFLERPIKEQFFAALKAFEAQESIHATTYEHASLIKRNFGIWTSSDYIENFDKYEEEILAKQKDDNTKVLFSKAARFLKDNRKTIDLYANFLTHWDFVPHNFRISGNEMYLLDHSSIRFGNKYEGWARFLNFMVLYNPDLELMLLEYLDNNRNEKELLSLKLMRIFRLSELIWHYVRTLENAHQNLKTLNQKRIDLWINALASILDDRHLDQNIVSQYKTDRDSLRDDEEKKRQIGLH